MKAFNSVLNIVLLIAVIFLFYREFIPAKETSPADQAEKSLKTADFDKVRMAYINYDTLVARYDYQQELKQKLEQKAKEFEADLAQRSRVFQESVALLQEKAPGFSQHRLQQEQLDLQQVQQRLMQYQEGKRQELAAEEQKLVDMLREDMNDVLSKVQEEFGLSYIMSYDRGSDLLAVDDTYNITEVVLKRLNDKYGAAAKDSVSAE
jgi:outer membrane protein